MLRKTSLPACGSISGLPARSGSSSKKTSPGSATFSRQALKKPAPKPHPLWTWCANESACPIRAHSHLHELTEGMGHCVGEKGVSAGCSALEEDTEKAHP